MLRKQSTINAKRSINRRENLADFKIRVDIFLEIIMNLINYNKALMNLFTISIIKGFIKA